MLAVRKTKLGSISRTRDQRAMIYRHDITEQIESGYEIRYISTVLHEILCFFAPLISPSSDVVGVTEGVPDLVLHSESRKIPCSRLNCSSHFPPSAPSNSQTWLDTMSETSHKDCKKVSFTHLPPTLRGGSCLLRLEGRLRRSTFGTCKRSMTCLVLVIGSWNSHPRCLHKYN